MADRNDAAARIRGKIAALARELGRDPTGLSDDAVIPQTGLLDSASLITLILWYEGEFGVSTEDEELTIDNFGTIRLMVDFLQRSSRS
jgi:acyl carrier protein